MTQQTEALEAALPSDAGTRARRTWVAIRDLGPHHSTRILAHLLALNEPDRLLRFGQAATDEQIQHYVKHIDFERDLVFGVFNRRLQLVAMAHLAFAPSIDQPARAAEFGVSVLERARGRGHGAQLFDHAVTHARNRGARNLLIYIARENSAMMGIVRRAGASLQFDGADVTAELPLPLDTLGSQLEELVSQRAAEIDYRIKWHVLQLDKLWPGCMSATSRRH
ncbi:MAG: GNAT family N-acetyltransferase [Rubrivivax sp.]|nr:GNAT family N-acetyltransferase [Rubrivivax sp.]